MKPVSQSTIMPSCVYEAVALKKEYDDGQVQALRGVDFRIEMNVE